MKGKHSTPAFFFLYHPDRDSREFAALARKEGYDRILLLRRENPFVANLHPIQAESERSIWAVYLMDFRRPATHSSDAWNCEEAAKTLDCNIRIELSLPANATVSAVCQALKYCYSTRSVSDARIRATDCRGRTAKEILEDLDMADDSLDRLKTANPYIANEKLDDRPAMYLSSKNFAWDTRYIGLVVSHNGVNDGDHLPAGMAHGRHVGLPFIPFFLKIKL